MPAEFDRMVNAIKRSLKKQNPKMKEKELTSRAYAIATDRWKKAHGGKAPSREKIKDWRILEFFTPIEESFLEGEDFIIKGVAINETTTLNNVKYIAEELEKSAKTFRDVPILENHENLVRSIVGRTTERVDWNPNFRRIEFEGKIMDKEIQEMIKDGRIKNVSIGAKVQDLIEEEDGSMKAIGIRGLEISLVGVSGDSQANLAQAIQHSLVLKEKAELQDELNMEDKMAEEEEKTEEVPEEKEETTEQAPEEKSEEEKPEESKEEKVQKIDVKVDTSEISDMKKQISELKELLMDKKKIQEQIEDEKESEEKPEESEEKESEDETKGEVSTEAEEKLDNINNLIVEAAGKGNFSMYRDYSREGTDTNLKRLVR